LQKIFQPAGMA